MQNAPFLHVDGDMYLPSGLPAAMRRDGVITQNKEKGSEYYKGMMSRITARGAVLPGYLSAEVGKKHIGSYNMGLMGGCDLPFIHRYCEEAFRIVRDNGWGSPDCATPDMNNNLLFEQVLLYALARKCGEKVGTVINETLGDNKYTYEKTCDMKWFDKRALFHLLGGHKRNKYACAMMEKTLLRKYPDAYVKVLGLFGKNNPRCATPQLGIPKLDFSKYMGIYQRRVNGWIAEWNALDSATVCGMERQACDYMDFLTSTQAERKGFMIGRHPALGVFMIPASWPAEAGALLKGRINEVSAYRYSGIAAIPTMSGKGFKEVLVNDLQCNILESAKKPIRYGNLLRNLRHCFSAELMDRIDCDKIAEHEMEYLLFNGLITAAV